MESSRKLASHTLERIYNYRKENTAFGKQQIILLVKWQERAEKSWEPLKVVLKSNEEMVNTYFAEKGLRVKRKLTRKTKRLDYAL